MNLEKSTPELFAAIAKAQAEVENATKNAQNPHFKSRYADLAEVLNTVRPVFAAHGLSLNQSTEYDGQHVKVTTCIGHAGGGYITSTAACIPGKADAQGVGSATSYLRRYSLAAMTGVAQEDDDGNAASGRAPQPAQRAAPPRPAAVRTDSAISADELAEIRDLCRSTKTNETEFAKWLGAADLSELRSDQLPRAKRALEAKAAKMQAEAA